LGKPPGVRMFSCLRIETQAQPGTNMAVNAAKGSR
jgi:hypothetical protein